MTLKSGDNTKFDSPTFAAIEYNGVKKIKDKIKPPTTFKTATDELITAVNKGIKFGDNNKQEKLQLGDTLKIIAGNIDSDKFKSDNIKIKYQTDNKTLLIGIKDEPTFANAKNYR